MDRSTLTLGTQVTLLVTVTYSGVKANNFLPSKEHAAIPWLRKDIKNLCLPQPKKGSVKIPARGVVKFHWCSAIGSTLHQTLDTKLNPEHERAIVKNYQLLREASIMALELAYKTPDYRPEDVTEEGTYYFEQYYGDNLPEYNSRPPSYGPPSQPTTLSHPRSASDLRPNESLSQKFNSTPYPHPPPPPSAPISSVPMKCSPNNRKRANVQAQTIQSNLGKAKVAANANATTVPAPASMIRTRSQAKLSANMPNDLQPPPLKIPPTQPAAQCKASLTHPLPPKPISYGYGTGTNGRILIASPAHGANNYSTITSPRTPPYTPSPRTPPYAPSHREHGRYTVNEPSLRAYGRPSTPTYEATPPYPRTSTPVNAPSPRTPPYPYPDRPSISGYTTPNPYAADDRHASVASTSAKTLDEPQRRQSSHDGREGGHSDDDVEMLLLADERSYTPNPYSADVAQVMKDNERLQSQLAALEGKLEELRDELKEKTSELAALTAATKHSKQCASQEEDKWLIRVHALEAELREERAKRIEGEKFVQDVKRECREPFIVPALMEAFLMIGGLSSALDASSRVDTAAEARPELRQSVVTKVEEEEVLKGLPALRSKKRKWNASSDEVGSDLDYQGKISRSRSGSSSSSIPPRKRFIPEAYETDEWD